MATKARPLPALAFLSTTKDNLLSALDTFRDKIDEVLPHRQEWREDIKNIHENGDVTFPLSERWFYEHKPGFSLWVFCEEMPSPLQRVYYDEIDGMTVEGSDGEAYCDHLLFDYVYPEKAPGTHVMTTGDGDVALHYEVSAHEVTLQELRVNRVFLCGLHETLPNLFALTRFLKATSRLYAERLPVEAVSLFLLFFL